MADHWHYKTLRLAQTATGDPTISTVDGHPPKSTVLTQCLSDLADDKWELYVVIPGSFIQGVGTVAPTMILRKLVP